MNMFLHNINYDKFNVQLGNTLIEPHFGDDKPFDAIVSNPPYSVKWIGSDDPTLINDERFAPAGVQAPNLFYGTTIAVNILVLSKHKTDTQFIDASGLFKKETNNNVLLDLLIDQIMAVFDSNANVDHFAQSVPFEKVVANDYNLSVSSHVEAKDNRTVVDIAQLNAELKTTVTRIDQLRKDIDAIVVEIEGDAA
jgi:type I restriction enzyme M protein